jgi:hypothetical protein
MSINEISYSSFENPALYLISLLLNPKEFTQDTPIPSDFGLLYFNEIDLLQERGRVPQLMLDFTLEKGVFRAVYFGYVSPFKLHYTELKMDDLPASTSVFSKGNELFIPMEAARPVKGCPQEPDWNILAGSLSLWRACIALPTVCDESLGKYFSKMKSVSRYQWSNDSYEKQGDSIFETWSSCIPCGESADTDISISLVNGLLAEVKI